LAAALLAPSLGRAAPGSKSDCQATARALGRQAQALSKGTGAIVPREFARVASDLDDSCNAGDFAKAQVSIDWMNVCLKNFTKPYKLGYCSRNKSYFCAVYPQSDACLQSP
jgi:hypothetical protein